MYFSLLLAAALVPLLAALSIWRRTGDPLHVGVILAPLFSYAYGVRPLILFLGKVLDTFFFDFGDLCLVQGVYLLSILALFLGLRAHAVRGRVTAAVQQMEAMAGRARQLTLRWAAALTIIALASYAYGLRRAGGIFTAFGQAKGGVSVSSGYIGEAPLLGFVASFLFAVVWAKRGLSLPRVMALVLPLAPFALQATLGGRRGPMFMVGMTLLVVMSLVSRKRLTIIKAGVAVAAILLAVVFVMSQRAHVYIGSGEKVEISRFAEFLMPEEVDEGDEYITGASSFLATFYQGSYYWGRRYFVMFFVRPIPRQLWPRKYAFFGMEQIDEGWGAVGGREEYWSRNLGRMPLRGSSWGLITDLFQEFSWACIPFCYLLGWTLALLRKKALLQGGVWSLLYLECYPVLIFLPMQSFTAAAYRFLILMIPSILLMRRLSRRQFVSRLRPARVL